MDFVAGLLVIALVGGAPSEIADVATFDPPALNQPQASLSHGDTGLWVAELNERLSAAGFHAGDGAEFDKKTRHAVYALQKHHGLETDGEFTPEMWDLLEHTIVLPTRQERNRVEVDLAKQVLYLVEEGRVTLVLPISSANGATYRHRSGSLTRAVTPEGKFTFDRKVDGWRKSYLGFMWNPYYFRGGYAIHGSKSVPNRPASHGCIRLTMWDMDLVKTKIELGWPIYIYGKRTSAPEPYTIEAPQPLMV